MGSTERPPPTVPEARSACPLPLQRLKAPRLPCLPRERVDGRYLLAAVALVAGAASWSAWRGTDTALLWSLPFALILLFVSTFGHSPAAKVLHLTSDEALR